MSSVLKQEEFFHLAAAFKVLGTLFRVKPSSQELVPFLAFLNANDLGSGWPVGEENRLQKVQLGMIAQSVDHDLDMHWQRLFIGPNHLEAPPWGSVYLDREQIVFGDSSIELSMFLRQIGMRVDTGMNEPEDHVGLMFWYMAGLLEKGNIEQLKEFLAEHFLPWVYRYLELLREHAGVAFYEGCADLAELTLRSIQQRLDVVAAKKMLYS